MFIQNLYKKYLFLLTNFIRDRYFLEWIFPCKKKSKEDIFKKLLKNKKDYTYVFISSREKNSIPKY